MNKVIVYDSDHPGAKANQCFEPAFAFKGSGNSFTVKLGIEAKRRGFEILTADQFLQKDFPQGTKTLLMTDMYSASTKTLLRHGVVPFLCFSTESPLIAKDFYINIKKRAGFYIYNIQFRGTELRLRETDTIFQPMFFPVDSRVPLPAIPWGQRKFLILVNRNKRAFFYDFSTVPGAIRSILSIVKLKISKITDPWIRSREIYKDRIEAIFHFSKTSDFDLYGEGWDRPIAGFPLRYQQAAKKVFRGGLSFEEKLPSMGKYKFAICFENCSFPGYVTEKIFDCFLAGCIPIYYGAPDIEDFVPASTFIDFRKFNSFHDLNGFLLKISEEQANNMLQEARSFLASPDFDKFFLENIVDDIINKAERTCQVINQHK